MRAIKNVRLKDYDYSSDGFYFVTVCTNYRKPYLTGEIKKMVAECVKQLPEKTNGVKLDCTQMVPSHVHLILVLEGCQLELSETVRRFKATTSRQAGFRLWQPNY
jgi:putative transposase